MHFQCKIFYKETVEKYSSIKNNIDKYNKWLITNEDLIIY